ncbi:MAG: ankyrin repeat domain-containing protein [Vicinamibacterales bacterium]
MPPQLSQTVVPADPEALFEAARSGDRAAVVSILDRGADVNARSRYGVTALGFAADKGQLEIVRLLVDRGADVHVTDSFYGSRPIDFALRGAHPDVALFLLSRGSKGAAGALNFGIRNKNMALVEAALATDEIEAASLAPASVLADRLGGPDIAAIVKKAAASKPATVRPVITLDASALSAFVGRYLNPTTGAAVTVPLLAADSRWRHQVNRPSSCSRSRRVSSERPTRPT